MGRQPLTTRGCLYEGGRGVELRLGIENMITNKKYSKTGFSWTGPIRWTLTGEPDGLCQSNSVYTRPRRKKAGWLGVRVIQAIEQGYYFRIEEMWFTYVNDWVKLFYSVMSFILFSTSVGRTGMMLQFKFSDYKSYFLENWGMSFAKLIFFVFVHIFFCSIMQT